VLIVNCDEHTRDVSLLVLAGSPSKPIVKSRLATRECRSVMLLAERLDGDCHAALSDKLAMTLERRNEFLGRGWRIGYRVEEGVAIAAGENHALVLVEHSTRALVGEVSGCQPGDGHGAPNELLRRSGDTQLDTFPLELTIGRSFAAYGAHGILLRLICTVINRAWQGV
jgi:hypothetical protein